MENFLSPFLLTARRRMSRTNVLSGFLRKLSSPVNKAKSSATLREDADDQNLSFDFLYNGLFSR